MGQIKKAFVLAGGNDQIELIKGLKKRFPDCEVILLDMNPKVRAREFADRMLVISTMDFDKVLEAAKEENIDLILSACGDQPLRTMAYISEKLNLPCYLTYELAQNLTNKKLMKRLMAEGGIPTSSFISTNLNEEIDLSKLRFPIVIKPADNNGSKGVRKVVNREQFNEAIAEAKRFSICGDIIFEEFNDGQEYSIEAFINDGEPVILFASKNHKIKDRDTFTICCNEYVSELPEKLENAIKEVIVKIGNTFKIDNVPLLIQLIEKDNELSVVEFSARTGGGSKLFFMREMCDVDVIEILLDITFGKKPDINPNFSKEKAIINYVYANPGVFTSIENIKGLAEKGFITASYQYKPFGSEILSSNYSSDRPIGFLIKAPTKEELITKVDYVNKNIRILDEKGNDIMRHDLFKFE